jgi:DNA-binding PadR family transcriptional regulator
MLSKSATMMLGLINRQSQNAYEIIKVLEGMNVRWWYDIADSTVYATLHTLDSKDLIVGVSEKNKNTPYRTVYSISDEVKNVKVKVQQDDIIIPKEKIVLLMILSSPAIIIIFFSLCQKVCSLLMKHHPCC